MGESKHERKVFLHLGIGVGHGGWGEGSAFRVVYQIIECSYLELTCMHVAILHDQLGFRIWPCYY